ncbi:MAG: HAMP domain-containing protein [Magnetococcales bacterium]|nr:HAMP domain-containing protein [Magnetococcales bacterium]
MNHPIIPGMRRSLIVTFTLLMLACALVLIPLLTGFQIWKVYLRELNHQQETLLAMGDAFRHPLEVAVWNEDSVSIEAQLGSIVRFPGIARARLTTDIGGATEGTIFSAGMPSTGGKRLFIRLHEPHEVANRRILGELELEANRSVLNEKLTNEAYEIVILASFQVLCLSLLLTIAVRHLVSKRIALLARQVERLGDNLEYQPLSEAESPDELGLLAQGINRMQLHLQHNFTEMKLLNDQIQQHRDRLEVLVQERTTALTVANQELAAARLSAEMANRIKSDFLANISHEIRTPMNAMVGFAHLMLQSELTPRQHENMQKIDDAIGNLMKILGDLLDFSKIDAGELAVHPVPFNLMEILGTLHRHALAKGLKKGLNVNLDAATDLPRTLIGDPVRLGQIMRHLVENAIKFTSQGAIQLVVRGDITPDHVFHLDFSVRDTGIGIGEEQMAHLFQPFSQVDGSSTRRFGGTGLGLAICRHLLELVGGDIRVESVPGVGSTFFVRIPYPVCTMEHPMLVPESPNAPPDEERFASGKIPCPAAGKVLPPEAATVAQAEILMDRLEFLMQSADPEAGDWARKLADLLSTTTVSSKANVVFQLANDFDFDEAINALGSLRRLLTESSRV